MKTMLLMSAIAAGFMINANTAEAQGGHRGGERPSFETLDANSDGQVTLIELQAHRATQGAERFAQTDTNSDGALSLEEMTAKADEERMARATRRAKRMIERLDANDDGLIQQSELSEREGRPDRAEEMFAKLDTDSSGGLSAEEFEAAKKEMRGGRDGGRHGGNRDN